MWKRKVRIIAFFFVLIVVIIVFYAFNKKRVDQMELLRLGERFDLKKNEIQFENIGALPNAKVYWIGYLNDDLFNDTILIYSHAREVNDIPDSYGKSFLILEAKEGVNSKAGLHKFKPWYKHKYQLAVERDTVARIVVLKWHIFNAYESQILQDTLPL
jgi:hypothetical protein